MTDGFMRVLVCGDRNWDNKRFLFDCLDELRDAMPDPLIIIHGCARGADTMAGEWAKLNHLLVLEYPAEWHKYGKSAGPIRNRKMLEHGKPDLVLAFHPNIKASRGTKDMIEQARKAGVTVRVNAVGLP